MENKDWFAANWSNIVSGIIAIVVIIVVAIMAVSGQEIPDLVGNMALIVLAFFFGVQVPNRTAAAAQRDIVATVHAVKEAERK